MTTLALAPQLDAMAAPALAAQLRGALGQDLVLDASGVARLGGQCLQVLLAARSLWAADGAAWRIANPPPALVAALATLGADELLRPLGGAA